MEELIVRINNLLRLTKGDGTPITGAVSIGKFEFVPNRYELKTGDTIRKLSHREAMLLQVLSENKNTIVTRKDVLLRVCGAMIPFSIPATSTYTSPSFVIC